MINWFCGVSDVAFYSVAYSVSSIINTFTDAITQTLTPWRYQNMKKKKYAKINKINISILALVGGLVAITNLLAPEIIYIFGGERYAEAVWVIPPIILSVFFIFMYGIFSNVEFYFLKTKFMMVASVSSAILNILLNYVFIGRFGYIACAYTSLFCYVVYTVLHYLYMCHICKKEIGRANIFDIKAMLLIALAVICIAIISTLLYNYDIIRYGLILIILSAAILKRREILKAMRMGKNGK